MRRDAGENLCIMRAKGRTSQAVSKPALSLKKAGRGDQMVAHKTSLINGLCRAHSVRSDSTHPDSLGCETAWSVRPYESTTAQMHETPWGPYAY